MDFARLLEITDGIRKGQTRKSQADGKIRQFLGWGGNSNAFRSFPLRQQQATLHNHTASSLFSAWYGTVARLAGSGLPLADLAWTPPLSAETVAKAAVRCCLNGEDDLSVKGKESGDAVVIKVQEMAEMEA